MVKNSRRLTATLDGGFEIDAEEAVAQVTRAIDDLVEKSGELIKHVQFAAVSSFWHSLMGVDADGKPATRLFAWAETRPAKYVSRLKADLDERMVHSRTGCPFHSSYWPAKLLWLKKERSNEYRQTAKWLSFSDYLGWRIFGDAETSISIASATGIYDIRKQQWDSELLAYMDLQDDLVPEISDDSKTFFLNVEYAARWESLGKVRWSPAVGDGAANSLGTGCLTKSKATLMIGTSGAMRVSFEGDPPERIPEGLWCYRIDTKRVVMGGAISDGGGLYRWLKDNLRLSESDKELESRIAQREPAAHGLTFLPFIAGERSTGYNDFATGAILGLKTATDQIDILQAALESVAYRFFEIYKRLSSVFGIEEIIASGGALRESPVWMQIICDVIGKDMLLPPTREASSRGVVLLAAQKAGLGAGFDVENRSGSIEFTHNPAKREAYDRGYEEHKRLYEKLVRE